MYENLCRTSARFVHTCKPIHNNQHHCAHAMTLLPCKFIQVSMSSSSGFAARSSCRPSMISGTWFLYQTRGLHRLNCPWLFLLVCVCVVVVLFETPGVWLACFANMYIRIIYIENMDICLHGSANVHARVRVHVYAVPCALTTNST